MLASLHVKNLALIDEEEIIFGKGLNILSGETGAGKSIILGALHLSLGDKASKDMLRDASTEAFVEAVYLIDDDKQKEALRALGVEPYDDEVIMSRKITESRSVGKINGEQVPASLMQEVGAILLDIYGQKEHQSLLSKKKHMELLDAFAKDELLVPKQRLLEEFARYRQLKQEMKEASVDDSNRERELALLEHEINEITAANLKVGEDDELEEEYRHLLNYSKIMGGFSEANEAMDGDGGAGDLISRAISAIRHVEAYDSKATELLAILSDAESIVSDFNHELSAYMSDSSFDEKRFREIESRLNEINRLKDKYGRSIEMILEALAKREEKQEKLLSFDAYLEKLKADLAESTKAVDGLCEEISGIRKAAAFKLSSLMRDAMTDLNFLSAEFSMNFERTEDYTAGGFDDGEFMISTNPGEPLRPLKDIASGGEMSRIMLAIKTVLASKDDIDTLIFDEIDAGISGRTASAVAEKLSVVAKGPQVICITHLPQIASMADTHFLIEKNVVDNRTISGIKKLSEPDSVVELARMLGGTAVSEAVMDSAREMKKLAVDFKKK